jgi:hypothetical protein
MYSAQQQPSWAPQYPIFQAALEVMRPIQDYSRRSVAQPRIEGNILHAQGFILGICWYYGREGPSSPVPPDVLGLFAQFPLFVRLRPKGDGKYTFVELVISWKDHLRFGMSTKILNLATEEPRWSLCKPYSEVFSGRDLSGEFVGIANTGQA